MITDADVPLIQKREAIDFIANDWKLKSNNKEMNISVEFKKNNKDKEINRLLNSFNKMDLKDIQSKLKSKGIDVKKTKKTNKNKLLKYIYLLTCVDDNINVIKG